MTMPPEKSPVLPPAYNSVANVTVSMPMFERDVQPLRMKPFLDVRYIIIDRFRYIRVHVSVLCEYSLKLKYNIELHFGNEMNE